MNMDSMNRRSFVLSGASSVALLSSAPTALAQVGDWRIMSLSDGSLTLPASMVLGENVGPELEQLVSRYSLSKTLSPPCNLTLLQNGDRNVLIDAGAGPEFQASAGQLLFSLENAGLAPDDITDVLFTHAHPDHIWGVLDDFDDLTFWNATYQIGSAEFDYWMDPNTVSVIGEDRASFAVGAARRLERIADQIMVFNDGDEVLPGIAARGTSGHTPGHMAFEVRSGNEAVMILGDCIGNHHVAFEQPDWHLGSDQDPAMAATTRVSLLDQLASEQTRILGFHLPGGGLGRVERKDSGYRFVPK